MSLAYSLTLSEHQMRTLLSALEPNFGQAFLESDQRTRFSAIGDEPLGVSFNDGFNLGKWNRGRAFGDQMEIRWRPRDGQFRVLIISEDALIVTDDISITLGGLGEPWQLEIVNSYDVQLWGEWQDPDVEEELAGRPGNYWYEERIPQFLSYPFSDRDKFLAVKVKQYIVETADAEGSQQDGFIYRFAGINRFSVPGA